ncbi:MAG: dehydrogenase [Osedax symbiont Rs2]|nr:MAG: dehydrogenase [Osedax symbiont Rs2]
MEQTYNQLLGHYPFNLEDLPLQEQEFLASYLDLVEQCNNLSQDYIENGQVLCISWIRAYSELAPLLPRDLLWFFGGDCLHYMPDEEIEQFQRLDELRFAAESSAAVFDYATERAKLFNLVH